jgi:hypothetical protein
MNSSSKEQRETVEIWQRNKLLRETLAHIRQPYSIEEIKELYIGGAYNSELLLQHALVQLSYFTDPYYD